MQLESSIFLVKNVKICQKAVVFLNLIDILILTIFFNPTKILNQNEQ